jgi:hypothetical protein
MRDLMDDILDSVDLRNNILDSVWYDPQTCLECGEKEIIVCDCEDVFDQVIEIEAAVSARLSFFHSDEGF